MSRPWPHLIRIAFCRRASSAVEFALIAPVFLLIVFGILTYGTYFAVMHGLQQLAAEAARVSVAGITSDERTALAESYIDGNLGSYPLIEKVHLAIAAAPSSGNANVYVVTLTYDASAMLIYALPHLMPAPPPIIVRAAAIQRGGY